MSRKENQRYLFKLLQKFCKKLWEGLNIKKTEIVSTRNRFLFTVQQLHKLKKAVCELSRAIHLQPDAIQLYIIRYGHRNWLLLGITWHLSKLLGSHCFFLPTSLPYVSSPNNVYLSTFISCFELNVKTTVSFLLLYSYTNVQFLRARFLETFLANLLCR